MIRYSLPDTITEAQLADACQYTKLPYAAMASRPAIAEHLVAMHMAIVTQQRVCQKDGGALSVEAEDALICRMQSMHADEILDQLV